MGSPVHRRLGNINVTIRPKSKGIDGTPRKINTPKPIPVPSNTSNSISRAERLQRRQIRIKEREARLAAEKEDREIQKKLYAEAQKKVIEAKISTISSITEEFVNAAKLPPEEPLPELKIKVGCTKLENEYIETLSYAVEHYIRLADNLQIALNDHQRAIEELRDARMAAMERINNVNELNKNDGNNNSDNNNTNMTD